MVSKKRGTKPRQNLVDLEKAKSLYMRYTPLTQIAEVTGIPRATIGYHAKKTWDLERGLLKAQLFSSLAETKQVDFAKMTQSAITIMSRALEAMAARCEPPTLVEATKAADVLNTLDKITRLDEGKATDIVSTQEKPMTIESVQAKIALDPFAKLKQIENVQYEEADKNTNDDKPTNNE